MDNIDVVRMPGDAVLKLLRVFGVCFFADDDEVGRGAAGGG